MNKEEQKKLKDIEALFSSTTGPWEIHQCAETEGYLAHVFPGLHWELWNRSLPTCIRALVRTEGDAILLQRLFDSFVWLISKLREAAADAESDAQSLSNIYIALDGLPTSPEAEPGAKSKPYWGAVEQIKNLRGRTQQLEADLAASQCKLCHCCGEREHDYEEVKEFLAPGAPARCVVQGDRMARKPRKWPCKHIFWEPNALSWYVRTGYFLRHYWPGYPMVPECFDFCPVCGARRPKRA